MALVLTMWSNVAAAQGKGNELVRQAAEAVFNQPGIEAKVRQRTNLFGQEMVAAGIYQQLDAGRQKLLRLEVKTQIGEQTATLMEIRGRQDLWIRRHLPPAAPQLEHVSLTRLRSALAHVDDQGNLSTTENWILLGGLPKLLENLHRNFVFGAPREAKLADVPVIVLKGTWNMEVLKSHLGGKVPSGNEGFPEQIPPEVTLVLGRPGSQLALFPFRLEYWRTRTEKERNSLLGTTAGNADVKELIPLSTLEFYDVRIQPNLDPRGFEFDPGNEESQDKTQSYLRQLEK